MNEGKKSQEIAGTSGLSIFARSDISFPSFALFA